MLLNHACELNKPEGRNQKISENHGMPLKKRMNIHVHNSKVNTTIEDACIRDHPKIYVTGRDPMRSLF